MGYIGNEPTTGHFPVDNFTSSGGSTYTLAKAPASAGAIEVSVQGVLQPTTAYTVSGATLTMAGVTTGVKIFVRHLGETLSLPTPADGSVTTTKLGTNSVDGTKIAMGSDAQGDILYHGATDYTRLAKGTAAQALVMNAGATAPEWADAAGGGSLVYVSTSTASSSASLDIALSSTYDSYLFSFIDILPATDSAIFWMRLSNDGGSTFETTGYKHGSIYAHGNAVPTESVQDDGGNDAEWQLTAGVDNYYGISGECRIFDHASSTYSRLTHQIAHGRGAAGFDGTYGHGGCQYVTEEVVNGIQFLFSTGNIASGKIHVYGIAKS